MATDMEIHSVQSRPLVRDTAASAYAAYETLKNGLDYEAFSKAFRVLRDYSQHHVKPEQPALHVPYHMVYDVIQDMEAPPVGEYYWHYAGKYVKDYIYESFEQSSNKSYPVFATMTEDKGWFEFLNIYIFVEYSKEIISESWAFLSAPTNIVLHWLMQQNTLMSVVEHFSAAFQNTGFVANKYSTEKCIFAFRLRIMSTLSTLFTQNEEYAQLPWDWQRYMIAAGFVAEFTQDGAAEALLHDMVGVQIPL